MKRTDFHFSRRALREAIRLGDSQLKLHLARLVEMEYLANDHPAEKFSLRKKRFRLRETYVRLVLTTFS